MCNSIWSCTSTQSGKGGGYHDYHQFSKFLNRLKRKNIIFLKNRFSRSFLSIFRSLSFFGVFGANWLLGGFEPLYASIPVAQQPYHDGLPLCYDSNCSGRNLYNWVRFWLHTVPELKMTRTRIRTSDLCIEGLQTSALCYSGSMWSWYTCILIISHYLSSPLLSYLIFRESWLDIVALECEKTWPENPRVYPSLWFKLKFKIVSERRSSKIPFGVPNESAGSVV